MILTEKATGTTSFQIGDDDTNSKSSYNFSNNVDKFSNRKYIEKKFLSMSIPIAMPITSPLHIYKSQQRFFCNKITTN